MTTENKKIYQQSEISDQLNDAKLIGVDYRNNGEGYGAPPDRVCKYMLEDGRIIEVVDGSWDELYKQ